MSENREEQLKHLAASLKDAKEDGGAILLVGAGISVSAGIPPAFKLMKIAIENFPNYFTEEEQRLAQEDLSKLQYNNIMTKLSPIHRKKIFNWHIKGNENKNIPKAKLNFAHLAIAELLKQCYIRRILTTNFDPLLINACYMVGMYPLPSIYDLGSINQINPELFDDPCIIYLNGQHAGQVQRNTPSQFKQHQLILNKVVLSTGCKRPWIVAGYSGENDPLMVPLNELRPYNNWLYWLEYGDQILQKESHHFLENDEECKVIYSCDADETFMDIAELLNCSLDFIERPYTELELYSKEINFLTAKAKGKILQSKIENYISILKSENRLDKFRIAKIITEYLGDSLQSSDKETNDLLIKICEENYPALKGYLSADFFYWWGAGYETRASLHSKLVKDKITNYLKAIQIYEIGIKKFPSFIGNYYFTGYCFHFLMQIEKNEDKVRLYAKQALFYLNYDMTYNEESVLYSIDTYMFTLDIEGLLTYINTSDVIQILKNARFYIDRPKHIEILKLNTNFQAWFKKTFNEDLCLSLSDGEF